MTARLFEGNNVDREFLVYRTVIQVDLVGIGNDETSQW